MVIRTCKHSSLLLDDYYDYYDYWYDGDYDYSGRISLSKHLHLHPRTTTAFTVLDRTLLETDNI